MNLQPKMVLGESGRICMQITLGEFSLTEEMPDELAQYDAAELQAYFNSVAPGMARKLLAMQRKKNRKLRKMACGSRRKSSRPGSAKSNQPDETPSPHL